MPLTSQRQLVGFARTRRIPRPKCLDPSNKSRKKRKKKKKKNASYTVSKHKDEKKTRKQKLLKNRQVSKTTITKYRSPVKERASNIREPNVGINHIDVDH